MIQAVCSIRIWNDLRHILCVLSVVRQRVFHPPLTSWTHFGEAPRKGEQIDWLSRVPLQVSQPNWIKSHKRSALVSEGPKLALLCKHGLHKMKCPNAFLPNLLWYKYLLIIRFNAELFSNRQTRRPVLYFSFFSPSWVFRFTATIFILYKPGRGV